MSSIDESLAKGWLRGGRHAALGEIAKTVSGLAGKTKGDFADGNARYVSYKNAFSNPVVDQEASDFVFLREGEKQHELHDGDVVFTGSSENFDDVGMSSVVLGEPDEPLYLNSFCFALRFTHGDLLPEFSRHLFRSEIVRAQIRKAANGVTRINISKVRFMRIRVPIPPLEVQREVARVLDAFGELDDCLSAEVEARRSQLPAVRTLLPRSKRIQALTSGESERVPVGDIATRYVEPVRVEPDASYRNLGVKWYGEGAFAREPKLGAEIKARTLYRVKPDQFIYNRMFVTEGSFGLVTEDLADGVVSSEFPTYDLDTERVIPEWLYLYFQDPIVVNAAAAEATGGTKSRRRWKEEQFEAFQIRLPAISAQREIVRRAQTVSQLIESLEAEIVARRTQYSHYRDRLMTFEEGVA